MTTWGPEVIGAAEVVIRAPADRVAAALTAPRERPWHEGLRLHRYHDRGSEGARFVVTGALVGSCEWWIETLPPGPGPGGVVVYFWLRGRATRDGDHRPVRDAPGPVGWIARRRSRLAVRTRTIRFRHLLMAVRRELAVSR